MPPETAGHDVIHRTRVIVIDLAIANQRRRRPLLETDGKAVHQCGARHPLRLPRALPCQHIFRLRRQPVERHVQHRPAAGLTAKDQNHPLLVLGRVELGRQPRRRRKTVGSERIPVLVQQGTDLPIALHQDSGPGHVELGVVGVPAQAERGRQRRMEGIVVQAKQRRHHQAVGQVLPDAHQRRLAGRVLVVALRDLVGAESHHGLQVGPRTGAAHSSRNASGYFARIASQ